MSQEIDSLARLKLAIFFTVCSDGVTFTFSLVVGKTPISQSVFAFRKFDLYSTFAVRTNCGYWERGGIRRHFGN